MVTIFNDDCLNILKTIEENSIDSLVTDPPAGIGFMGKDWDHNKGGRDQWVSWISEIFKECNRVLKPGAHGLVWALPRTSHWTATALEDAGFEIRDVITHLFGSGFPKSLNISKAINKAATNEAKQWQGWGTALKPSVERWLLIRKPLTTVPLDSILVEINKRIEIFICQFAPARFAKQILELNQKGLNEVRSGFAQWIADVSHTILLQEKSDVMDMFSSPEEAKTFLNIVLSWNAFLDALLDQPSKYIIKIEKEMITDLKILNSLILQITPDNIIQDETKIFGKRLNAENAINYLSVIEMLILNLGKHFVHENVSMLAVDFARLTLGLLNQEKEMPKADWSNDIILVRKPLSEKNVAANVLKFGVGGINVDECRIEAIKDLNELNRPNKRPSSPTQFMASVNRKFTPATGRFPANLILSHTEHCTDDQCDIECAIKMLDEQSGPCKTGKLEPHHKLKASINISMSGPNQARSPRKSFGGDEATGASRFFYCAKISKADKNEGLDTSVKKVIGNRPNSGDMTGKFPDHDQRERSGNFHPTVKATKLMQYLIKLVTPPNGIVLDPFMGSGSTGKAAILNNFSFIGIEKEKEYFEIAKKRIGAN